MRSGCLHDSLELNHDYAPVHPSVVGLRWYTAHKKTPRPELGSPPGGPELGFLRRDFGRLLGPAFGERILTLSDEFARLGRPVAHVGQRPPLDAAQSHLLALALVRVPEDP